jgi:putative membrane protein
MRRTVFYLLLLFVVVFTFACKKEENENAPVAATTDTTTTASSTSATTGTPAATGTVNDKDKDFITDTGKAGKAEAEVAQDAIAHATNADVKAFAQKLVDDHTKANNDLTQLAGSKGVTLPSETEGKMKEAKERLMKLTGKSFDQAFVKQMVDDHTHLIKEFEEASKRTDMDADLKKWIDATLPTLRDHLAKAKSLQTAAGKK